MLNKLEQDSPSLHCKGGGGDDLRLVRSRKKVTLCSKRNSNSTNV
uniref:Uncharacterized protein n=1 Tax=Anguilla anguilla TaxID=7936 RepID=A0A0E9X0T0_ANGAN